MCDNLVVYKQKLQKALKETNTHVQRINEAFEELGKTYQLPLEKNEFILLLQNRQNLAFADQIIYRFAKAQDSMGAKLFKSFVEYQGDNANRPFLDLLNSLEKLQILNVDEWFELREIRNEIAHDYDESEHNARNIINNIFNNTDELQKIVNLISHFVS